MISHLFTDLLFVYMGKNDKNCINLQIRDGKRMCNKRPLFSEDTKVDFRKWTLWSTMDCSKSILGRLQCVSTGKSSKQLHYSTLNQEDLTGNSKCNKYGLWFAVIVSYSMPAVLLLKF